MSSESESESDRVFFDSGLSIDHYKSLAEKALEAMYNNSELSFNEMQVQKAFEKMKLFPRFSESLIFVSLTTESDVIKIGNGIFVQYTYNRKVPRSENKKYVPLSTAIGQYALQHDLRMMKNSKLPVAQIFAVASAAVRKERANPGGWSGPEIKVLQEAALDLTDPSKFTEVAEEARIRLQSEFSIDRSLEEITSFLKLARLYNDLQNFDSINLCDSDSYHNPADCIALVRKVNQTESRSEEHVVVERKATPTPNSGRLEFGMGPIEPGTYLFHYYVAGSGTPACVSAPFECVVPDGAVGVSSQVAVSDPNGQREPNAVILCGEPLVVNYSIGLERPHHTGDRVALYREGNLYGDAAVCVLDRLLEIPAGNVGSVVLDGIRCPGMYVAKYHLGQLGGRVLAASQPFEARLTILPANSDGGSGAGRGLRFLLVGTVRDLAAERAVLREQVVPAVQAALEALLITVTVMQVSEGIDEDEFQPQPPRMRQQIGPDPSAQVDGCCGSAGPKADLSSLCAEVDRCFPRLIFVLGEQYGHIPAAFPDSFLAARPWLAQTAERTTGGHLPGARTSIVEALVLHGVLARAHEAAMGAVVCLRDSPEPIRTAPGLSARLTASRLRAYQTFSEYHREAQEDLRRVVMQSSAASIAVHYCDVAHFAAVARAHLEAAVARAFPGAVPLTPSARIRMFSDAVFKRLANGPDKLPLVLDGPVSDDVVEIFESPVPVILAGPPYSGKSVRLASALLAYFSAAAAEDLGTIQSGLDGSCARGRPGLSLAVYGNGATRRVLLAQVLGLEMTGCCQWAMLRDAMQATCEALGLLMDHPWDEKGLLAILPTWLDIVLARSQLLWVIDGLDVLISTSAPEVCAPLPILATDGSVNTWRGPALQDEAYRSSRGRGREGERLLAARVQAQARLWQWLMPLLDDTSPFYAPRRFPGLRLVVVRTVQSGTGGDGREADPLRACDAGVARLVAAQRKSLRIVRVDGWSQRDKARFVTGCLGTLDKSQPGSPGIVRSLLGEIASQKNVTELEGKRPDPYTVPGFTSLLVQEAAAIEELVARDLERDSSQFVEAMEQVAKLKTCLSVHELCVASLQRRLQSRHAELAITFLYLARFGLREMELLNLMHSIERLSDEAFLRTLRSIKVLLMDIAGFLILKPEFKEAMFKRSEINHIHPIFSETMVSFFKGMKCEQRQMQELPLLYLRLGQIDQLLEYICCPSAFRWISNLEILDYVRVTSTSHSKVTCLLKDRFESWFNIRKGTNCKYDLGRIEKGDFLSVEEHFLAEQFLALNKDNSARLSERTSRTQNKVDLFCNAGLNVVDLISSLSAGNLEIAEAMVEGILKMLHCCNSLSMASEKQSKYPKWSFECLISYCAVFETALNALYSVESSSNRRLEDLREQRIIVMQELIQAKVKLLIKIAEGISEQLLARAESTCVQPSLIGSWTNTKLRSGYHGSELLLRLKAVLTQSMRKRGKYLT